MAKNPDVQYVTTEPTTDSAGGSYRAGDYWVDTDADGYPVIYRHNGTAWVLKDKADSTNCGRRIWRYYCK